MLGTVQQHDFLYEGSVRIGCGHISCQGVAHHRNSSDLGESTEGALPKLSLTCGIFGTYPNHSFIGIGGAFFTNPFWAIHESPTDRSMERALPKLSLTCGIFGTYPNHSFIGIGGAFFTNPFWAIHESPIDRSTD